MAKLKLYGFGPEYRSFNRGQEPNLPGSEGGDTLGRAMDRACHFRIGDFLLDPPLHRLSRGDDHVRLTPKATAVLMGDVDPSFSPDSRWLARHRSRRHAAGRHARRRSLRARGRHLPRRLRVGWHRCVVGISSAGPRSVPDHRRLTAKWSETSPAPRSISSPSASCRGAPAGPRRSLRLNRSC